MKNPSIIAIKPRYLNDVFAYFVSIIFGILLRFFDGLRGRRGVAVGKVRRP